MRQKQIKPIEELKQINLNLNTFDQKILEANWHRVIDESHLDYEEKCDQIKVDLIHADCLLVEELLLIDNENNDFSSQTLKTVNIFTLWIWYNNREQLKFFFIVNTFYLILNSLSLKIKK